MTDSSRQVDQVTAGDVAATFCATLVDEWVRAGVHHAVVSPGSRSTPLALALADEPRFRVHVHHDERCAGFMALGLALRSGRPAVVLTTSGTAAVELHPSVVEAHHAHVPMVVCTADRPPSLADVGAPQTIDQLGLYGSAVRWSAQPGLARAEDARSWRALAARAVGEAQGSSPGPVHLNLAFDEPLVGMPAALPPGRDQGRPWRAEVSGVDEPDATTVDALTAVLSGARGVIVVGAHGGDPAAVHRMAETLGWPVLADPRSGCRIPSAAVVAHADALLRAEALALQLQPDVVVRLGDAPASKVLGAWMAGLDAWQVQVHPHGALVDPHHVLDCSLHHDPTSLCERLADAVQADTSAPPDGWQQRWVRADASAAEALTAVLGAHSEPTEPAIARDVLAAVPDGTTLVVSSSMPVRDLEWYGVPREGVAVVSNRGANGIDGVVSTALGVAAGGDGPVVVLIGDVAMLHDTNALLGLVERRLDLTIVVVHNDGGGIFSFLPQAGLLDSDRFERLFGTPHGVDLAALAGAHHIDCVEVGRQGDVGPTVAAAVAGGGARMVLVRTDRAANVAVHEELHATVIDAVTPR